MTRSTLALIVTLTLGIDGAGASLALAQEDPAEAFRSIGWVEGPHQGQLGSIAQISIPSGYAFAGKEGAQKFLELTQNPTSGTELGIILPWSESSNAQWFMLFEFEESGYVKDDERDSLDADAILKSVREGNEHANKVRRERGWPTLEIVGWERPPFYDAKTKNLTWAIRGMSQNEPVINYSTRLLGRRGVMQVNLVLSPDELPSTLPHFEKLVTGYTFQPGQKYAEFRKGDKVAAYGLTALIAGGAGAAAVKSGLLGKFWKLIVVFFAGVLAFLKKIFNVLTGRSRDTTLGEQPPPQG